MHGLKEFPALLAAFVVARAHQIAPFQEILPCVALQDPSALLALFADLLVQRHCSLEAGNTISSGD